MDGLTITILFIAVATAIGAFVRRTMRDKCLKDFRRNIATLERVDGKTVWGRLNVENTGLEFVYEDKHKDEQGHDETSFIIYKHEYQHIQALIRYHDQLGSIGKKQREKELKRTYHPPFTRRLKRRIKNVFKTVRDSIAEVATIVISRAQKRSPVASTLTAQGKYVSKMKDELIGTVGTSFEPLLEKYIGHKVVLEMIRGDKIIEYCGVLKEYTAEFIEIMDVDYSPSEDNPARKADVIVPRKYGIIRHLGE